MLSIIIIIFIFNTYIKEKKTYNKNIINKLLDDKSTWIKGYYYVT